MMNAANTNDRVNTPIDLDDIRSLASNISSLISVDVEFEGNMTIKKGIKIDGVVAGDVIADESIEREPCLILVGATGRVTGNISGEVVAVYGTIDGSVRATRHLEIYPGAVISGDIYYKNMKTHDGAIIEGVIHNLDRVKNHRGQKDAFLYPVLTQAAG